MSKYHYLNILSLCIFVSVVNEAGFDSIEVKMKYEGIYIPVLLTSELMNMKVIDVSDSRGTQQTEDEFINMKIIHIRYACEI